MIKYKRWYDSLIGCPSQCYYYIKHKDSYYCIYLRWRHTDPWTANLIEFKDNILDFDTATWSPIYVDYWEEDQLEQVKEDAINRVRKYLDEKT